MEIRSAFEASFTHFENETNIVIALFRFSWDSAFVCIFCHNGIGFHVNIGLVFVQETSILLNVILEGFCISIIFVLRPVI